LSVYHGFWTRVYTETGPFANFDGHIAEVDIERGKVRVVISMFGRETPIELDFEQIEKLS